MSVKPTLRALGSCIVPIVLAWGLAACDEESPSESSADGADDVEVGEVGDAPQIRDSAEDLAEADSTTSGQDKMAGEPCDADDECARGLLCVLGACQSRRGCAGELIPSTEYGCLIEDRGGGSATVIECSTDSDCASNPYGQNCIRLVCTDQDPCATNDECTSPETCYEETLCLPEE